MASAIFHLMGGGQVTCSDIDLTMHELNRAVSHNPTVTFWSGDRAHIILTRNITHIEYTKKENK